MSRISRSSGAERSPARTVTDLLAQVCASYKQRVAFIDSEETERRITFAQFGQDVLTAAGKLLALRARHIAVVCENSYDCILTMFAVMAAGKVLIPLDAQLDAEGLSAHMRRFDAELVLGAPQSGSYPCPSLSLQALLSSPGQKLAEWPAWEQDLPACIVCTSGTTGTPRGVVLTQRNMAHANSCGVINSLDHPARQILYLPLHHILTIVVVTTSLQEGNELYISRSVKYFVRDMERARPDALTTVPMINEMYRSRILQGLKRTGQLEKVNRLIRLSNGLRKLGIDLRTPLFKQLRERAGHLPQLVITGAAASQPETLRFFDDIGVIVLQVYGMTETTGSIANNTLLNNRTGSVGRPKDYCQVRLCNGEILVRGGNVFREYYNDPAATAEAFDGAWFRTGDLGYMDGDGNLFITGRCKNLIILDSGENVSPEELEQQLTAHPAVAEAVVYEKHGKIHAEIYARSTTDPNDPSDMQIKDAVESVNRQNPPFKRISSWSLRSEPFEKNASMKIRRHYEQRDD